MALSTDYSTSQSELFDPTLLPNYDCECYIPDEPADDTGLVFLSSSSIYFFIFPYFLFVFEAAEVDISMGSISGRQ